MFKLEWDINAANFTLLESDAYVDAIIIYRMLLRKGYVNLKLNTVEEFLKSKGRIAYPSRGKTNKVSGINHDTTCNNQEDQIPHKITPYNVPTSQASDINYYTACNHQQDQKQLSYNVQNGLVNTYSGPNTWSSYYVPPNHYIQNTQQVQDSNIQATNKEKHVSDISSHNQISNQTKQLTHPAFKTQVANSYHQSGIRLPEVQYHLQATPTATNINCNVPYSAQEGLAVPNNYFYPYTNSPTYPILSANNQNYPNSHNTNNINQNFHPTCYSNDSNVQTNITNNSGFCSPGKKWDSQADKFVMKAFYANIFEMWARLKQDGYSIEIDEIMASLNYQGVIHKNKMIESRNFGL